MISNPSGNFSIQVVNHTHLPEDSATSLSAIKRLSPSTNAKDKFTHPG